LCINPKENELKTPKEIAQEAAERGLTLRQATNTFLGEYLPPGTLDAGEEDNEAASRVLLAMRSFQEGAYWAVWRLHFEYLKDHPKVLDTMESIIEEREAVVQAIKDSQRIETH
jgi:hypothetical protein